MLCCERGRVIDPVSEFDLEVGVGDGGGDGSWWVMVVGFGLFIVWLFMEIVWYSCVWRVEVDRGMDE